MNSTEVHCNVGCATEAKDLSMRVRHRAQAYKPKVKKRLGLVDEATLLSELQVVVSTQYWITRARVTPPVPRALSFTENV